MKLNRVVFIVIIIGLFIRLYRFPELLSFSYEQALALEASAKMLTQGKISLIGVEYFIRQTTAGHSFFNSAFYLYPLSLIQFLFGFNPIYPTLFFLLLNFIGGVGLYLLVKKTIGDKAGITSLIIYMFSPSMVDISRYIWHVNVLVPLTVLTLWILFWINNHFTKALFVLLGFVLGLGFGLHVSYAIWAVILASYLAYKLPGLIKISGLFFLSLGFVIGNIPTVIFDLRHDFYNIKTMYTFLLEKGGSSGGVALEIYHFIYFFVIYVYCLSWLLGKYLKPKLLTYTLLLISILSIPGWRLNGQFPRGMPVGTNIEVLNQASKIITEEKIKPYEVAAILDGETRAENLRYFLSYVYSNPPMNVAEYPNADTLYVLAYFYENPLEKNVWEVNSLKPATISATWEINNLIKLHRITRIND